MMMMPDIRRPYQSHCKMSPVLLLQLMMMMMMMMPSAAYASPLIGVDVFDVVVAAFCCIGKTMQQNKSVQAMDLVLVVLVMINVVCVVAVCLRHGVLLLLLLRNDDDDDDDNAATAAVAADDIVVVHVIETNITVIGILGR
jgi:hypothetical protein